MDPAEERFAIKDYAVRMNKEREEMHRKEAEKLVHAEACKLVDSAGALLNCTVQIGSVGLADVQSSTRRCATSSALSLEWRDGSGRGVR